MKGTPSKGKSNKKATHILCRRCGHRSFNRVKGYCSHCGYGKTRKLRKYAWQN